MVQTSDLSLREALVKPEVGRLLVNWMVVYRPCALGIFNAKAENIGDPGPDASKSSMLWSEA